MNTLKKGIIRGLLAFTAILVYAGCDRTEVIQTGFNENLINQHLDRDVTFSETYRPQFHYTPRMNWMNDPNGLVYYEGRYHLFHQYNPFGNRWGYMSWNHAVSDDLVHWEHRPVAIPYGKEEEEGIFSGSAVADHENTSGFGDGTRAPLIAIYTSDYGGENPSQAQSIAYSIDGGETFVKYEGNPVLEFDDPDFRDPKVMWMDEMNKWVMVVALPTRHKVRFYASDNLIDWEFLSDFGPAGAIGGIWECPDIFPLAVDGDPDKIRWVLHVDMNPGSVAGGSGSQFFVGDWDGTQFIADESISGGDILWVDYGTDFYAAITWNNIPEEDGRRMWIGWMSNWMYANELPTDPWRSAMSIPRSLHLVSIGDDIKVIQRPVEELKLLRDEHVQLQDVEVASDHLSLTGYGIAGKAYELLVEIEPRDAENTGIKLRAGNGEETLVGYDAANGSVFVDRTNAGVHNFHENFDQRYDAPARLVGGRVKLHIFVDWSSVEVFVNNGETVITNRIFPAPDSQDIILYSEGGSATFSNLDYWSLNSVWK